MVQFCSKVQGNGLIELIPYNRFFVEHPNIYVILKAHL